jgi:DNA-binding NtrC family response regulator
MNVELAETLPRLLIVDDEGVNRRLMKAVFASEGFDISLAEGGRQALDLAAADPPSIVLLDLRMPDLGGLEVLEALRERSPHLPIIMLTAYGDIPAAVQATRLGATDFLVRPIHNDELVLAVRRALEKASNEPDVVAPPREPYPSDALVRLRGLGVAMQRVVELVTSVASSPLTVLLQGETGTGKEVVARAVHQSSGRHAKPFVALDCGAIPEPLLESELFGHEKGAFSGANRRKEGQFQLANGGTLFLDEVANFNLSMQAKLLRVIQERKLLPVGGSQPTPIDVRLIAATNQDLEDQVRRGEFRQDLYFRLAEFVITLPPLRDRKEDVLPLARRFVQDASLELRRPASNLSPEAEAALEAHDWPGNVRELRNAIRQATLSATGATIQAHDLGRVLGGASPTPNEAVPLAGSLRDIADAATTAAEKQAITEALRQAKGNKAEAARLLKTDYKTLYLKLKRYGLRN